MVSSMISVERELLLLEPGKVSALIDLMQSRIDVNA